MKTQKIIAAGVLPICKKTGRIMLIRRGMDQSNPGTWATFGGKFEDGEDLDPKQTALREFVEESGYKGKFKLSSKPIDVYNSNHLKFYTFIGLFDEEFIPDLETADEAIDYGWFYLGEFPNDLHPGVSEIFIENKKTIENIICFYQDK
jgi:8-oxo-dGTP pyrophosphatase MutT (NUDIX family)